MTMLAVHAIITDTCRTNRTELGALDEAFQRIRNEYLILSEIHKIGLGVNLHVKLEVEFPPTRTERPSLEVAREILERVNRERDPNETISKLQAEVEQLRHLIESRDRLMEKMATRANVLHQRCEALEAALRLVKDSFDEAERAYRGSLWTTGAGHILQSARKAYTEALDAAISAQAAGSNSGDAVSKGEK